MDVASGVTRGRYIRMNVVQDVGKKVGDGLTRHIIRKGGDRRTHISWIGGNYLSIADRSSACINEGGGVRERRLTYLDNKL
jgi:hypothetical protein